MKFNRSDEQKQINNLLFMVPKLSLFMQNTKCPANKGSLEKIQISRTFFKLIAEPENFLKIIAKLKNHTLNKTR